MRRLLLVGTLLVLAACAQRSAADRAHGIEGQVWSPYCPGRLLIDCATAQARELRSNIAEQINAGRSDDEVLDWVRGEFGPRAIARPEASGTGLIIWLVPALIFAIGAVVVVRFLKQSRDLTIKEVSSDADP
jgi:cytochrome c-type biogenesis protein CcmH